MEKKKYLDESIYDFKHEIANQSMIVSIRPSGKGLLVDGKVAVYEKLSEGDLHFLKRFSSRSINVHAGYVKRFLMAGKKYWELKKEVGDANVISDTKNYFIYQREIELDDDEKNDEWYGYGVVEKRFDTFDIQREVEKEFDHGLNTFRYKKETHNWLTVSDLRRCFSLSNIKNYSNLLSGFNIKMFLAWLCDNNAGYRAYEICSLDRRGDNISHKGYRIYRIKDTKKDNGVRVKRFFRLINLQTKECVTEISEKVTFNEAVDISKKLLQDSYLMANGKRCEIRVVGKCFYLDELFDTKNYGFELVFFN